MNDGNEPSSISRATQRRSTRFHKCKNCRFIVEKQPIIQQKARAFVNNPRQMPCFVSQRIFGYSEIYCINLQLSTPLDVDKTKSPFKTIPDHPEQIQRLPRLIIQRPRNLL